MNEKNNDDYDNDDNQIDINDQGSNKPVNKNIDPSAPISSIAKNAINNSQVGETIQKIEETKNKVQSAAIATKGVGSTLVTVLGNPVSWVIIIVLILVTYLVATNQVIGRNENATGCEAYGVGKDASALVANSPDQTKRMNSIGAYFTATSFKFNNNKPLSVNQAAAIIGNMLKESGANPEATQNNWISSSATNAQIKSATGGGKAVGLIQWDSGRRTALANFAESQGTVWSDLTTQLKYLKKEFDSGEGDGLAKAGFSDDSKSVEELTEIFNRVFERSADSRPSNPNHEKIKQERIAGAKKFLSTYNGSYSTTTGGSCLKDSNVDMSDTVQLAIDMSWPDRQQSLVRGNPTGGNVAKPEYIEGKKAAMAISKDPWAALYASCDRFVATVIILTKDPDIPWGGTAIQRQYLGSSSKWQKYTNMEERQPGDIWITDGISGGGRGHIVIYVGDIDGSPTIAHASYMDRVAAIDKYMASAIVKTGMDGLNRKYWGFRFVG